MLRGSAQKTHQIHVSKDINNMSMLLNLFVAGVIMATVALFGAISWLILPAHSHVEVDSGEQH